MPSEDEFESFFGVYSRFPDEEMLFQLDSVSVLLTVQASRTFVSAAPDAFQLTSAFEVQMGRNPHYQYLS